MVPVLAPLLLLFMSTLAAGLGLHCEDDTSPADASPLAKPGNLEASLCFQVETGTDGDDALSADQ